MASVPLLPLPPSDSSSASTSSSSSAAWTEDDAELEARVQGVTTNKVYTGRSLFVFPLTSPVRQAAIALVDSPWFDRFILLAIVVNCGLLAAYDPFQPSDAGFNAVLEVAEYVFTAIFTLELLLKATAMGLVLHPHAYLRDPWHVLDFVVVCLGYLTLIPGIGNYSAIRTFRVLRALRTLTGVPGLRVVIYALLTSMPPLLNVFFLLLFVMFVFAIIGIQLFAGKLRQHCLDPLTHAFDPSDDNLCSLAGLGGRTCVAPLLCIATGPNPGFNIISFDHFGYALLTVLQIVTMDEWEVVLTAVLRTTTSFSAVYFVLVILFGALFIINLVVAVVYSSYTSSLDVLIDANDLSSADFDDAHYVPLADPLAASAAAAGTRNDPAPRPLPQWRLLARLTVESTPFKTLIIVAIILNTIALALEYPAAPKRMKDVLFVVNIVFTVLFALEMLFKLVALGPRGYVADRFNIFDGFIVIVSLVELVIADGEGSGLSVLRAFRLLRVFKLARSWSSLRTLLDVIMSSIGSIGSITLVMMIMIFIFALIGMQLYGGKYEALPPDRSRTDFDSFWDSVISVFRILIGEWTVPLYDAIRATNESAIIYFVVVLLVGNYLILNLFLAILLSNFEWAEVNRLEEEAARSDLPPPPPPTGIRAWPSRCYAALCGRCAHPPPPLHTDADGNPLLVLDNDDDDDDRSPNSYSGALAAPHAAPAVNPAYAAFYDDDAASAFPDSSAASPALGFTSLVSSVIESSRATAPDAAHDAHAEHDAPPYTTLYGNALFLLRPHSRIRTTLQRVVEHPWFEWIVLAFILASSIALAVDEPGLDPDGTTAHVLYVLDIVFTAVFTLELVVKVIVYGFWFHYGAYMTDPWNRLDAFIVVVSIISLSGSSSLKFIKAIRTLRALRPLRAITRFDGMRIVVSALFASVPAIANVALVCGLFWLVFAILGVQSFGGKFASCNNPDVEYKFQCTGLFNATGDDGSVAPVPAVWSNPNVNFDNALNAFLALFQVATFEGWYDVFWAAIDATDIDRQPRRNNQPAAAVYFFAFIVVGSFFATNLFVSAICDTYSALKDQAFGHAFLSPSQRQWFEAQLMMTQYRPSVRIDRPPGALRGALHDIVLHPAFELVIMGAILANMLAMTLQYYAQPSDYTLGLEIVNYFFAFVFAVEAAMKLVVYKLHYFRSGWNRFDLAVVAVSAVSIVIAIFGTVLPVNPTLLRILRVFRVARIFRIIKSAAGLRRLMVTLLYSLPSLVNVGLLLFLIYFVYAVLGMNLFGDVVLQEQVNRETNFSTFPKAMLLLFRISTGSGWDVVLAELSVDEPDCSAAAGNCGNFPAAVAYLVSFILVTTFVLVNLFVAVILESFDVATREEGATVTDADLTAFTETWSHYDPDKTYFIPFASLRALILELDPPLGVGAELSDADLDAEIHRLDVNVYSDAAGVWEVNFLDCLIALTRRVNEDVELPDSVKAKTEDRLRKAFPACRTRQAMASTLQIGAGLKILGWYDEYKKRKAAAATDSSSASATASASSASASSASTSASSSSSSSSSASATTSA